jgi:hypothetical protein
VGGHSRNKNQSHRSLKDARVWGTAGTGVDEVSTFEAEIKLKLQKFKR